MKQVNVTQATDFLRELLDMSTEQLLQACGQHRTSKTIKSKVTKRQMIVYLFQKQFDAKTPCPFQELQNRKPKHDAFQIVTKADLKRLGRI